MPASLLIRASILMKVHMLISHSLAPSTLPGTQQTFNNTDQRLNWILNGTAPLTGAMSGVWIPATSDPLQMLLNTL